MVGELFFWLWKKVGLGIKASPELCCVMVRYLVIWGGCRKQGADVGKRCGEACCLTKQQSTQVLCTLVQVAHRLDAACDREAPRRCCVNWVYVVTMTVCCWL